MYVNVISFKNGKTLSFQTEVPYGVDKVKEYEVDGNQAWNVVIDDVNGQVSSFKGTEVCTISSMKVENGHKYKHAKNKKPGLSVKVTSE